MQAVRGKTGASDDHNRQETRPTPRDPTAAGDFWSSDAPGQAATRVTR
jgi:hypothetical protein